MQGAVGRPGSKVSGFNCFDMFWLQEEKGDLFSQHLASEVCPWLPGPKWRGKKLDPTTSSPLLGVEAPGQLGRLSTCSLELLSRGDKRLLLKLPF